MSEKKKTSTRAPKTQDTQVSKPVASKKEKGIVLYKYGGFSFVKKANGSVAKIGGITAKVGDEIEI